MGGHVPPSGNTRGQKLPAGRTNPTNELQMTLATVYAQRSITEAAHNKRNYGYLPIVSTFMCGYLHVPDYDVIFKICPTEAYHMAQFGKSEFAALTLTSDHEKQFNQWVAAESLTGTKAMSELLAAGFKLSVSWIVDQSAFCFSIIGTDATKEHKNMVMTSWSDDLDEVACIAAFKHFVVCGGGKWPTRSDGPRWG